MVHINRAAMDQQFQARFIGPSSRSLGPDAWGRLIYLDDEWNNYVTFEVAGILLRKFPQSMPLP